MTSAKTTGNGPLPLDLVLDIAMDVARALSSAHLADIIHRDITPGNIFLTSTGVTRLLDFGLAKAMVVDDGDADDSTVTEGVTDFGVVPGTAHYLSPEQLLHADVDRRADMWALGAVLYHAATGARPFEARTKAEVMSQILSRAPMPSRRLVPTLPVEFEQVVMRLLDHDADRRYQRATDLMKDLETVRALNHPPAPPPPAASAHLSLAVLPFAIVGDENDTVRSFRDGLASDTAWALQQVPGVRVASRTSTDSVRGLAVRDIGARIGVDHVLEGSVQLASGRLRVLAGLAATATDERLRMPLRMDLPAADLLSAQDEAARQIATAVRSVASRASHAAPNPDAYVEYQRGLHAQRELFTGNWNTVIEHATRSTEIDPVFAPAHVLLADTYNSLGLLSLMKPRVAFQKARLAAERALAIDPDMATAHAALGLVRFGDDWDWNAAEAHFRRALDIDPDMAHVRVALQLAADAARPRRRGPRRGQSRGVQLGMYPTAHAELERAAEMGGRAPFYTALLGKSYGEAGMRDKALAIVKEFDELATRRYVAPHCYVYVYHGLGERERALLHQEDAYRDGGQPLNYLSPFIRNLFSLDPTHRDRLRQMRLTV